MKYEIEEWPDGGCQVLIDGEHQWMTHPQWGYDVPIEFESPNEAKAWIDQHAASQPKRYEYTPKMNPAKADAELGGTRDGRED